MINDENGKAVLSEFMEKVVEHLPDWKLNKLEKTGVYIQLDSMRKINFYFSKGMVRTNPIWPRGERLAYLGIKEELEGFRFNINRNPAHIANKIKKIIPEYLRIFERCLEKVKQREDEFSKRKTFAELVTNNYSFVKASYRDDRIKFLFQHGQIEMNCDGTLMVDVDYMPRDALFGLLDAIQKHKR